MAIKKITANKHLIARGLFALAVHHYRKSREAETQIFEMLGYEDDSVYCGCLSDEIYGDGDFDRGMKREEFVVIERKKVRR